MAANFEEQLWKGLVETYTIEQLQVLCMTLGVKYERVASSQASLDYFALKLIAHMRGNSLLGALLVKVAADRPLYLSWPKLAELEEPIYVRPYLGERLNLSDIVNELLEWKQAHHTIQNYWLSLTLIQRRVESLHSKPTKDELYELERSWHSSCHTYELSLRDFLNSKKLIRDDQEMTLLKTIVLGDTAFSRHISKLDINDEESLNSLYIAHLELVGLLPSILRTIDHHIINCAENIELMAIGRGSSL